MIGLWELGGTSALLPGAFPPGSAWGAHKDMECTAFGQDTLCAFLRPHYPRQATMNPRKASKRSRDGQPRDGEATHLLAPGSQASLTLLGGSLHFQ